MNFIINENSTQTKKFQLLDYDIEFYSGFDKELGRSYVEISKFSDKVDINKYVEPIKSNLFYHFGYDYNNYVDQFNPIEIDDVNLTLKLSNFHIKQKLENNIRLRSIHFSVEDRNLVLELSDIFSPTEFKIF
jgi:hypothetical protein